MKVERGHSLVSLSTVWHTGGKYQLAHEKGPGTRKPMELSVDSLRRRVWENTWSLQEPQLPPSLVAFTGENMINLSLYGKVSMTVRNQSPSAFPTNWKEGDSFRGFGLASYCCLPSFLWAELVSCWVQSNTESLQLGMTWAWRGYRLVLSCIHTSLWQSRFSSVLHRDQNLGNKQLESDLNDWEVQGRAEIML